MPELTVLMSVHNGETWIRDCIDSVLSQTEDNFEFIIINDGSTDRTAEILASYADKRIVVVTRENSGLTKSLNVGLNMAKGGFIARIDADDICMPDRFYKQKKYLLENPDVVLVGSNAILIDENGTFMGHAVYPSSHEILVRRLTVLFHSVFPHSSILFRKDIIMQEGGYNENFTRSQDYDLYLRLVGKYRISSVNEFLLKSRLNFSGPTYSDDNQLIMGLAALISHYRREAGLPDYSRLNDINWRNLLNGVRKWVRETGLDRKLQGKRNFRVCRTQFRQKNYTDALKTLIGCFNNNPMFFLNESIPIRIPEDIRQFVH